MNDNFQFNRNEFLKWLTYNVDSSCINSNEFDRKFTFIRIIDV